MLICERYLLVYLEQWKHRKSVSLNTSATVCLAGAGIMDLILRKKLSIEGKKLLVINTNLTGDVFLDEVFTMIKDSKKIRKVNYWINRISGYQHVQRYSLLFKSLESQNILQFEQKVSAKIFYSWKYDFLKPEVLQALLERIRVVFSEDIDPDLKTLCLISLLQISKLTNIAVSKEFMNIVKHRMEQLTHFGHHEPMHLEMIESIRKACKATVRDKYQVII